MLSELLDTKKNEFHLNEEQVRAAIGNYYHLTAFLLPSITLKQVQKVEKIFLKECDWLWLQVATAISSILLYY